MLDCLQNLVGLTDKECACFDESELAGFAELNESETGYYLTDEDYGLPMLESIYAGIDCGDETNVFSVLNRARTFAVNAIYTDLQAALRQRFDQTVTAFSGLVGQRRAGGTRTVGASATTIGQLWQPKGVKDGKFVATHIWVGVDTAGPLTISISSNEPDFVPFSQTVTVATGGVFQKFALTAPVELPLYSKNTDYGSGSNCGVRYAISYPSAGLKPMSNVFSCCGGMNTGWKAHIVAGGFETSDLDGLLDNCGYTCNGYAQGLAVEGYLGCDNLQWLCELKELNGKDLRDVLARAVQHKGAQNLAQHILDSTNINFWTTLNRESLYGKRNHAKAQFDILISWIADNLPNGVTGCYKCRPGNMQRRSF